MIAFGPDPALPLPGSPSRGPRACPGPLLVAEGVGGGVVGLWGGIIVASISAGGVGDEELGVSVSDVALQGLMQPPLAGSVDQVDPGGVEPTEPALERAGAREVVGEGQVQDLQVVLADERDLPTFQVGDVDLEGDVLVVPEGRPLSAREAPQRCREEVVVLREEVGDLLTLLLAESHPLVRVGDVEAMGPAVDGSKVPRRPARDAVLLVTPPAEAAGDLHPSPIGGPVAAPRRLGLVVERPDGMHGGHGSEVTDGDDSCSLLSRADAVGETFYLSLK